MLAKLFETEGYWGVAQCPSFNLYERDEIALDKKILAIAGIVFALVFVILMSLIFMNVINFGEVANNSIERITQVTEEANLEQYNETVVSGDTIIATINKVKETRNGIKMSYAVCNGAPNSASSWTKYGYCKLEYSASEGAEKKYTTIGTGVTEYKTYDLTLTSSDSNKYISPVQEYTSHIITSTNGMIVGVVFISN